METTETRYQLADLVRVCGADERKIRAAIAALGIVPRVSHADRRVKWYSAADRTRIWAWLGALDEEK